MKTVKLTLTEQEFYFIQKAVDASVSNTLRVLTGNDKGEFLLFANKVGRKLNIHDKNKR